MSNGVTPFVSLAATTRNFGHLRAHIWKHETNEAIWGCLLVDGDRLHVGNVDGSMTALRAGRRKELLAQIQRDAPLYSRPALIGDARYLATTNRLYLIAPSLPPEYGG